MMNIKHQRYILFTFVLICLPQLVLAQANGEKLSGGEYRKLSSAILKEDRTLIVIFPDDYETSTISYPVLYMLDAHQRRCSQAVTVLKELQSAKQVPQMILVGVVNTRGNRNRDMHPTKVTGRAGSGGASNFLAFLEREMKPFVEQNYRTTDKSTIIGYSTSAYFVVYCLVQKPELFDNYIASSPMLGYGREWILSKVPELLNSSRSFNKSLYIIYGGTDPYDYALNTTPIFNKVVQSNKQENFRYEYVFLEDEGHVPNSSLARGIAWTYSTGNVDD